MRKHLNYQRVELQDLFGDWSHGNDSILVPFQKFANAGAAPQQRIRANSH